MAEFPDDSGCQDRSDFPDQTGGQVFLYSLKCERKDGFALVYFELLSKFRMAGPLSRGSYELTGLRSDHVADRRNQIAPARYIDSGDRKTILCIKERNLFDMPLDFNFFFIHKITGGL